MGQLVAFGILAGVLGGCAGPTAQYVVPPVTVAERTLATGDTFDVTIYGEEELSGSYRVADDGTINFPLIGPVAVAGKDSRAVEETLQQALRDRGILRSPHVSVFVKEFAAARVSVLGAVDAPGSFDLRAGMTVVEAIGAAGGFTELANMNDTVVSRRVDGKLINFRVPVDDITKGQADDVPVQGGDIVFVPERLF